MRSDDFDLPLQQNVQAGRQHSTNNNNSPQDDSVLDSDDSGDEPEAYAAPPTRKRKSREQLEQTPEWMPAFIPAIMSAMGGSGRALSDDDITAVVHEVLTSVPDEGQPQPSIEEVVRELTKPRDVVPSCIEACRTVHKVLGHLVSDPASRPFKDCTEARAKAEGDFLQLEDA